MVAVHALPLHNRRLSEVGDDTCYRVVLTEDVYGNYSTSLPGGGLAFVDSQVLESVSATNNTDSGCNASDVNWVPPPSPPPPPTTPPPMVPPVVPPVVPPMTAPPNTPTSTGPPPTAPGNKDNNYPELIAGVVLLVILSAVTLGCALILCYNTNKNLTRKDERDSLLRADITAHQGNNVLDFSILRV